MSTALPLVGRPARAQSRPYRGRPPRRTRRPTDDRTAHHPAHSTPTRTDVTGALDGLAAAAEQAHDDAPTRAVLAVVVMRLEDAAGAGLGDACGDPLVVLQRRFGRAHARLAARAAGQVDADLLHGLARALAPEPVRDARTATRRSGAPALAAC